MIIRHFQSNTWSALVEELGRGASKRGSPQRGVYLIQICGVQDQSDNLVQEKYTTCVVSLPQAEWELQTKFSC